AKKRSNDVVTAEQQWWRAEPDPNTDAAAAAKVQALETERRALLATLLGSNWDTPETNQAPRTMAALTGPVLGELSPETKQAVQEISARSQQRGAAYLESLRKDGKEQDPIEVARMRQQTREELAKVLTPPQLEEFLLRYSSNASALRKDLRGFELSPDEFRNLFRALDPIDQQLQLNYTGVDATSVQQRAMLQKQRDDALRLALGPDRYREYQLARDSALREAVTAAQQAGAPSQAVQTVYQINQAVAQEQQRIQNDATLTPDEKAAQLAAVNQEQKSARDRALGLTAAVPQLPPQPPGLSPSQVYSYRPGETVDQIANRYGVSSTAIFNANPTVDFNVLQRGQQINIPPSPAPPAPPTPP
ncbi:MAG: hypothetical protein JWQ71_3596, partial [Pedosphaera sp.]|nr:hypothetical protein [Pedosphaera sp.]